MRAVFLVIVAAAALLAQNTSASIRGNIRGVSPMVPGVGTIPGLEIELILAEAPHTVFSLRAKDDGSFTFTILPAGTYTLTVAKQGFKTLIVNSIRVDRGEQKTLPQLFMETAPSEIWFPIADLELRANEPQAGNLSGSVVRGEGQPIARVTVQLFCGEMPCGKTRTDPAGRFVFFNLSSQDDYAIRVTYPGYYSWQGDGYRIEAGYDAEYRPIVLQRRAKLSRAASTVR